MASSICRVQFLFLSGTLSLTSCGSLQAPHSEAPNVNKCIKTLSITTDEARRIYINKRDPNMLFLSNKDEYGPGRMVNIQTGQEIDIPVHDYPGGRAPSMLPGETEAQWLLRVPQPQPVASRAEYDWAEELIPTDAAVEKVFYLKYDGAWSKETHVVPNGFYSAGNRRSENALFSGELIFGARGITLVRQKISGIYDYDLMKRVLVAPDFGLAFYRDEIPGQKGTLYIFKYEKGRPQPLEPNIGGVVSRKGRNK